MNRSTANSDLSSPRLGLGGALPNSGKRVKSGLLLLLLAAVLSGSACSNAANKFLNYPTRAFREVTGQKSREHQIIPIREDLGKYKQLEVQPVENLVGDQIPPVLVDRLNASLYQQLVNRKRFAKIVRASNQQTEDDSESLEASATGEAQPKAAADDTLVLESYIDNYHPGNRFLRLIEVGIRQAYITIRYRLHDKLTGKVVGAGSVTVDDFRALATKTGIINKATKEIAKQIRPADSGEIEKIEKLDQQRAREERAISADPVVVESECAGGTGNDAIRALVADDYKPKRGTVSLKGEILGGEFRVVTVVPFSGDFSKYRRVEIPRLQSLIGPDVPEKMIEKYSADVRIGFAKTCRFDEVVATRSYEAPAVQPAEPQPGSAIPLTAPQPLASVTDIAPLDAPMLPASELAIRDAQRITRLNERVDEKPSDADALVISGEVIDYAPGNRALQLLAPLNLGSSVLSIRLTYYDKMTGAIVGRQVVTGLTEGRMLAGPLGIRTALTAVSEGIVDQVTRRTVSGER